MHNHFNGLKTAGLFGLIWLLLLGMGSLIGGGRYIWIFALFGLGMTFYSYWNSDKLAIRAMRAYPVSEAQAPASEAQDAPSAALAVLLPVSVAVSGDPGPLRRRPFRRPRPRWIPRPLHRRRAGTAGGSAAGTTRPTGSRPRSAPWSSCVTRTPDCPRSC